MDLRSSCNGFLSLWLAGSPGFARQGIHSLVSHTSRVLEAPGKYTYHNKVVLQVPTEGAVVEFLRTSHLCF